MPDGKDEADNVEVKRWGDLPRFDFTPKEHFDLDSVAASMDFEMAAKTSGARFVMLKRGVARIHRALAQFMLDTHVDDNGLTEVNSPVLVRDEAMYGTDKLPKFGDDSYQTTDGMWLVPTSEVPLTYTVGGADAGCRGPAPPDDGAYAVLPLGGGLGGPRHGRHAAPAPVRKGGDGQHHPSRGERRGAKAHARLCRGHPRGARASPTAP